MAKVSQVQYDIFIVNLSQHVSRKFPMYSDRHDHIFGAVSIT